MELYLVSRNSKREYMMEALLQLLSAGTLGAGFIWSLLSLFGTACPLWPVLVGAYFSVLLCVQFSRMEKGKLLGSGLLAMLVLVSMTGFRLALVNGLVYLWNCAAQTFGKNTSLLLTNYVLPRESTLEMDLALTVGFSGVLVGCAAFLLQRLHRWWLLLFFILPYVIPALYLEEIPSLCGPMLFALGILLCLVCFLYENRLLRPMVNRQGMALITSLALMILIGIILAALSIFYPDSSYQTPTLSRYLSSWTAEQLDALRYKKGTVNTLPKGNLTAAAQWETQEDTALTVTMEKPSPLYLKGFVGSSYQTDEWEPLPWNGSYENQDLFYWLHADGFYGNQQLSLVRSYLEDDSLPENPGSIQVENLAADSEYVYLPYELAEAPVLTGGSLRQSSDSTTATHRFFGERSYSYTAYENLTASFPEMAAQIYLTQTSDFEQTYTGEESYYNAFVYEYYTTLEESDKNLLAKELGAAGAQQSKGHIAYASAIQKIRDYLGENIVYSTQAQELQEGQDFLRQFLTESKVGHSVQYATAAALMFRYYGIPARYVEGYLITPEDVEGVKEGEPISIPGSNGHAWAEIYVDGLGWVPVEMTPTYYDTMPQPDLTRGLQADSTYTAQEPQTQDNETREDLLKTMQNLLVEGLFNLGKLLLVLLLILDLFCILFFLYVLLRRFLANRKRKRKFAAEDHNQAVRSMIGYIFQLMKWKYATDSMEPAGLLAHLQEEFSAELLEQYKIAYAIGEQAAFSPHPLTDTQREQVATCMNRVLEEIKQSEGWYGRWIMRYIVRLY